MTHTRRKVILKAAGLLGAAATSGWHQQAMAVAMTNWQLRLMTHTYDKQDIGAALDSIQRMWDRNKPSIANAITESNAVVWLRDLAAGFITGARQIDSRYTPQQSQEVAGWIIDRIRRSEAGDRDFWQAVLASIFMDVSQEGIIGLDNARTGTPGFSPVQRVIPPPVVNLYPPIVGVIWTTLSAGRQQELIRRGFPVMDTLK